MQNNVVYLDDFRPIKPLEDFAPQFGGPLPEGFSGDFEPIKFSKKDWLELFKSEALGFIAFISLFGFCLWLWCVLP